MGIKISTLCHVFKGPLSVMKGCGTCVVLYDILLFLQINISQVIRTQIVTMTKRMAPSMDFGNCVLDIEGFTSNVADVCVLFFQQDIFYLCCYSRGHCPQGMLLGDGVS